MLAFAITVEGVTAEGKAQWVLAVDPIGERFLVVHEDNSMHWHPLADCTFVKVMNPDQPQLVMVVQPKQPLAVPGVRLGGGNGPVK